MDQNELKSLVGRAAVEYIKDGMIVGLGTGSTVRYMVDALGERVKNEGLSIVGVTTSNRTTKQAQVLASPSKTLMKSTTSTSRLMVPMRSATTSKASKVAVAPCFGKKSLPTSQNITCGSLMKARWFTSWELSRCQSR